VCAGADAVIGFVCMATLDPGDEVVTGWPSFPSYVLDPLKLGAVPVRVSLRDDRFDLEVLLSAITPRTKIVFIAAPNNPTGTFVPGGKLESFIAGLSQDVLVVLDEAYTEYLRPEHRYDSMAWLKKFPNLVITRTFSKVYGLAGLRVGYAVSSPAVADLMNRVRQPFNVNSLSLTAAAAALDDEKFIRESYELNCRGMDQVVAGLKQQGLQHIPSYGNFVTFKVPGAAAIFQKLLRAGVIVRPIAAYGMPDHLRVSIGLESESARFLNALQQALAA